MSKLISTLEQLHLLRARAVEDLSTKLASQNQLCQRFEKNIDTLTSLAAGLVSQSANSAAMMINQSKYKQHSTHYRLAKTGAGAGAPGSAKNSGQPAGGGEAGKKH